MSGDEGDTLSPRDVFALPMFGANDEAAYPYTFLGSCFVLRSRGRLWVVTAKHALQVKGYQASQVAIGSQLRLVGAGTLEVDDAEDAGDVVVFEAEPSGDLSAVKIFDFNSPSSVDASNYFVMHGFPNELNYVDYESGEASLQGLAIQCSAPTASALAGCGAVVPMVGATLASFSGFSGGPLFGYEHPGGPPVEFVGVLIRGSREIVHFAPSQVVQHLINLHSEATRQSGSL